MATHVVMNPGWEEIIAHAINSAVDNVAEDVKNDAQRYAPVLTGTLRESIHKTPVVDGTARVGSVLNYAIDVEMGHHIVAWGHDTTHFAAPQPFLRPALYQRRSLR